MPDLVWVSLLPVMRAKPWAKRPIHMYFFLNQVYTSIYMGIFPCSREYLKGKFLCVFIKSTLTKSLMLNR